MNYLNVSLLSGKADYYIPYCVVEWSMKTTTAVLKCL